VGGTPASALRVAQAFGRADAPSAPDALGLLKAFRRRWRAAIGFGLLGAIIAALATWCVVPPAKYTAEATLIVEAEQPRIIVPTKENRLDPDLDRRTQIGLIKSTVVLSKVLSQPDIANLQLVRKQGDPAEWLEREITVEFTGKILRLSLGGDNPVEVAHLIEAVTQAYLNEVANKEKIQRRKRNDTLEDEYEKLQQQLDAKRRELRDLSATLGSRDRQNLSAQQRLAISRQTMAEEELLRTQSELKRIMAELKVLQEHARESPAAEPAESNTAPADADLELAIQKDPGVQELIAREQQLLDSVKNQSRVARKASDPYFRSVQNLVAQARSKRKLLEERLRQELRAPKGSAPEVQQHAESSLAGLQHQVDVLTQVERDLKSEVSKVTNDTQKLDSKALQMESIQDEIKSVEDMSKLIKGELQALMIELKAPDRIMQLGEIKVPRIKDTAKQVRSIALAAAGVFGAIVLLMSFWEFRARRIDSLEEVVHGVGMNVVGTMPLLPGRMRAALPGPAGSREEQWQHQLIESVDTTRIMLMHRARVESLRVVLVTSAVGGEGKTSLASHLATSLARAGQKTLLCDCDMRRPMVHRIYDQPRTAGFCELARGEIEADDAIRPTALPNLSVIPAGQYDDRALSVLAQARARELFDQLRERFDFIILDSAPVLPVADTLLLTQHVDAALFSILRDVSQLPKIQAAHERIAALGVPILGAVLAGTHSDSYYRY
jgi:capsular exopolysaccharide synthesis family protein